jgi:hypothetical protein
MPELFQQRPIARRSFLLILAAFAAAICLALLLALGVAMSALVATPSETDLAQVLDEVRVTAKTREYDIPVFVVREPAFHPGSHDTLTEMWATTLILRYEFRRRNLQDEIVI